MSGPAKKKEVRVSVFDKDHPDTPVSFTGSDRRSVCDEALGRTDNPKQVGRDLGGFVEGRVDKVLTPYVQAEETERVP